MSRTVIIMIVTFLSFSTGAFPQSTRSQADLVKLQTAVDNAKLRVIACEKKLADADSVMEAGKKKVDEAKAEMKQIDSESKKYEKDYAERYKPVKKLTASKDKAVAKKAANDLRALETEYRKTDDAFVVRMNNAYKKQSAGVSAINKGKSSKASAQEALKNAEISLKAAQKKYDEAAGK